MNVLREVKRELEYNCLADRLTSFRLIKLSISPKAWGIALIRLAAHGSRPANFLLRLVFHCEIGSGVTLGELLWIPHPYGIVVASGTVIGDGCSVYHRTTFAEKQGAGKGPTIGDNSVVGAGTVVLGNIVVGKNVSIGPNSVVIHDVPANVIAFGNPLQFKPPTSVPQPPTTS